MRYYLIVVAALLVWGCEKTESIEGLWVVKSVSAGDREVTPNGRWMRFNSDGSQESGNGWFQHSVGTWAINEDQTLEMTTSNGLTDPYEKFTVSMNKSSMTWEREEEGVSVKVSLERAKDLPTTYGDDVLGLWKLVEAEGSGNYFAHGTRAPQYVFFRWDKKFEVGNEAGKIFGVYNVHGHRPEVELIPYGGELDREFWKIQYGEQEITLTKLNTDSTVVRRFNRIYEKPN